MGWLLYIYMAGWLACDDDDDDDILSLPPLVFVRLDGYSPARWMGKVGPIGTD